jgi:hypothetical protein
MEPATHETCNFSRSSHLLRTKGPVLLALAAALCLLMIPVTAHAPTAMNISFDPDTAKIYVTITHPVDDPTTHYIKTVRVMLNDLVISDPDYKSQPTKDTFT